MIKFFRKIRQKLLKEGKTANYFKYALGEIVLVVIGILIAVQVNSWSENRKIDASNQLMKEKMIGELKLNINRLSTLDTSVIKNGQSADLQSLIATADTAIWKIQKGLDTAGVKWLLGAQYFVGSSLNLHTSVYEEMKNTGRLYSLGSDSLIHSIDRYYRRIDREEFYNTSRNERAIEAFNQCKYGLLSFGFDYHYLGDLAFEKHSWIFDPNSLNYQDLKMALYAAISAMEGNRGRMLELVEVSKELIERIEAEMNEQRD